MNGFEVALREVRNGECLKDMSQALAELVKAVRETGKKGAVSLRLCVSPAGTAEEVLLIEDEIKKIMPKEKKAGSIFFATDDNGLQRNDPRQRELPLVTVVEQQPELRKAV